MADDARRATVGDYVTLVRGTTYKGQLVGEPGPALLGLGSIEPGGGFRTGNYKTYGGDCPEELMLFPGDVYASLKGATKDGKMIGSVARVPPSVPTGRLTQDTVKLVFRITNPGDATYLYWVLRTPQYRDYCAGHAMGSAVVAVSRRDFLSYPVPPPTTERRRVVGLLDAIEEKVELNRQMNQTLEAMARALFNSWFVDFDPVRAKAERRDPDLPKHVADLFPDAFEDSELGKIPSGWEVKPLSDCVEVARGLSYKGSGLSKRGVPMHNLNSIYEGGGYKHDGLKRYDGEFKSQHVTQAGDLIVANTEQGHDRLLIGYAAIVPARFAHESIFSHHIYRVRPKHGSKLTPDYLCHLLNTAVMHDTVSGYANGTTVNMLPVDGLQSPLILVPPVRAISAFGRIAELVRMCHEEMIEESGTLAALRDALLPKLTSGELRLRNAEKLVMEVS
jgi:restriction endonuclease S subunit